MLITVVHETLNCNKCFGVDPFCVWCTKYVSPSETFAIRKYLQPCSVVPGSNVIGIPATEYVASHPFTRDTHKARNNALGGNFSKHPKLGAVLGLGVI